jgi:hypothetical protein
MTDGGAWHLRRIGVCDKIGVLPNLISHAARSFFFKASLVLV